MSDTLRSKILASQDIPGEQIDVPEWGVTVEVRGLSSLQRSQLYADTREGESAAYLYLRLVVATTFDPETGEQLFAESDIDALGRKSAEAIDRITQVAMRLSGMGAKAVDEEGKDT